MTVADFTGDLEQAREFARRIYPYSGCVLASQLLAWRLDSRGVGAEVVEGHYLQPGQRPCHVSAHWWVQVDGLVLDPTRDQYGEDPLTEACDCRGSYLPVALHAPSRGAVLAETPPDFRGAVL